MSISQRILDYIALILWMLIMLTIVHTLLSPRIAENDMRAALDHTVNMPVAAINMLANLMLAILVAPRLRQVLQDFSDVRPLAAYSILVMASVLWSSNPPNTLRRASYFVIDALAATYFGSRYSMKDLNRIAAGSVVALMLISVLAYIVHPAMVLDVSHPGEWMGVSEHKNVFGQFIAFGLCFIALGDFGIANIARLPVMLFSLVMLWLSHSTTSWLAGGLTVLAIPLLSRVRSAKAVWRPMVYIMATLLVLAFAITGPLMGYLLNMFGKDPTLTGRTDLWIALIGAIARHPMLGYGYAAFFSTSGELITLQSHSTWVAPSAHNGYLQIGVDMGLVGLAIMIWFLLAFLAAAIRYAQQERTAAGLIPLTAIFFVVIHNCAEISLLQAQSFTPFVIYMLFVGMKTHTHEPAAPVASPRTFGPPRGHYAIRYAPVSRIAR